MGWSCTQAANKSLNRLLELAVSQGPVVFDGSTGPSSNSWTYKGSAYFLETSRREHGDGAITGTVYREVHDKRCVRAGSLRIEGDGTITRASGFPAPVVRQAKQPQPLFEVL